MMSKSVQFVVAVFLAMGSMFSLAPRQTKLSDVALEPVQCPKGIAKHFEAAWRHLGNVIIQHG